jgi:hypothetical protein
VRKRASVRLSASAAGTRFALSRGMTVNEPRPRAAATELEILEEAQCRRRLAEGGVGRLALPGAMAEAPEIRPVNFALLDERVVIRTGEGIVLGAAKRGAKASFEIDAIDPLEHTGWSVVVVGTLSELPTDAAHLSLPLRPWASGQKERFVGLSLDRVSGLRIPSGRGNR